jgi:hypothetical protein
MKISKDNLTKPVSVFLSNSVAVFIICITVLLLNICLPANSYAYQMPWAGPCTTNVASDPATVTAVTVNGLCAAPGFPAGDSPFYDQNQRFTTSFDYTVADHNAVPVESDYRIVFMMCTPKHASGECPIQQAYFYSAKVHLVPNISISDQNPNFGTVEGGLGSPAMAYQICLFLVDDVNNVWYPDSSLPYACHTGTAPPLTPVEPVTCSLNSDQGLTVAFNELDRSTIGASPASKTSGNIEKTIPVTCSGESAFTVKTKFTFTPISVSNNQVVATSNPNLGVAIIYNGKVVSPTDVFDETYQTGTTNVGIEFQVIHDSSVATKDIATGDFSASAVMVMTQQ